MVGMAVARSRALTAVVRIIAAWQHWQAITIRQHLRGPSSGGGRSALANGRATA
jgi:hypothetical protein